ncbi:MAG: hypothetical protein HYY37_05990 [Candidatus Aenigmarchaeota archaeon]|nr:hypothetical protein [Candidatus Aenigmarchaeota archaeon]
MAAISYEHEYVDEGVFMKRNTFDYVAAITAVLISLFYLLAQGNELHPFSRIIDVAAGFSLLVFSLYVIWKELIPKHDKP